MGVGEEVACSSPVLKPSTRGGAAFSHASSGRARVWPTQSEVSSGGRGGGPGDEALAWPSSHDLHPHLKKRRQRRKGQKRKKMRSDCLLWQQAQVPKEMDRTVICHGLELALGTFDF